ncbi:MAG: zf-HC2 domain-containing protein [Chloroflexi bacterium]|nr:zf-HC2 domain-containing protein [Chloroflexota bacterium]
MSILDIFSRHPRRDISAHADGELAPDRRDALEAHVTGCERCHTELDELLAVRSALRDLPQVAAPRSFTLTPAMAEREPAPVASRTTPSFVAMRIAGAGFAAVLAVVVMLDAGGIVDDTGGRSSDESSTALFDAAPTNRDTATTDGSGEYGFDAAPEVSDGDIMGGLAGTPPVDDDSILPAIGGGVGGPYGSEDVLDGSEEYPTLDPFGVWQEPAGNTTNLDDGARPNDLDTGDDGQAAAPESGDGTPIALTAEDDGISSLLIIEIGLAAIAALAFGGSFVMRRRAQS